MNYSFLKYIITGCLFHIILLTSLNAENDSLLLAKITNETPATIFEILKSPQIQEVTIHTDIRQIMEGKRTNDKFAATLVFMNETGNVVQKSIELTPRGKSRRKYCDFPPLRIKFSKDQLVERGIRKDHKSLKLVTHCNEGLTANHNVLKEYLAYKVYQELTDNSLDVQLLKVNYEDTESKTKLEKYAFLLEDIDELAESIEGQEVEGFGRTWKELDSKTARIMAFFQYLIGNDDWSVELNRNLKFIQPNQSNKLIVIPYDFDSSGFVSAVYAKPNPNLKMKSIKQRYFMGKLKNKEERAEIRSLFEDKKEAIYQLVNEFELLDDISKLELKDYFDSFYKTIHSPKLMERAFPIKRKQAEKSDLEGEMHF